MGETARVDEKRIDALERDLSDVLRRHQAKIELTVKSVEQSIDIKVKKLLREDLELRLGGLARIFDQKLCKLAIKIEEATATKPVEVASLSQHWEDKDFFSNRLKQLGEEMTSIKREMVKSCTCRSSSKRRAAIANSRPTSPAKTYNRDQQQKKAPVASPLSTRSKSFS